MAPRKGSLTIGPDDGSPSDEADEFDDLTEAEVRQAEVGSLIRLQGPEFERVTWTIRRYRTRQEQLNDPSGEKLEWVADHNGGLVGKELIDIVGGGTFSALGYVPRTDGRGVRIKYNETFSLAGPRKDFAASTLNPTVVPAGNASLPALPNETDRLLRLMIREQRERDRERERERRESEQRFERMIQALAARPTEAPKPLGLGDLVGAVKGIHELAGNGRSTDQSPTELAKLMLDSFHQGITLGQERDPIPAGGPDQNSMLPVIEKGLEIVAQMIQRGAARRAAPPPVNPNAPPRPPSEARVVEEPQAAAAAPPVETPAYRWRSAIESVSRGLTRGDDPSDKAATLADLLSEEELANLRGVPDPATGRWQPTAAQVLAYLGTQGVGSFPQLETPGGQVYLDSVLTALRTEPDDSEDSGAEAP